MKSDANNLQRGVGGIPGRCVLEGAFDLIDECLNGKVGVVRCAKFSIVALQVGGRNVGVGCIHMVQDGAGVGGALANVEVAEETDKYFVHGGD